MQWFAGTEGLGMRPNRLFDAACEELVRVTEMPELAARGTWRLALRDAGLDPATVSARELAVVAEALMPGHLESRGVSAPSLAAAVEARLADLPIETRSETPDQIFRRLAGGTT